MSDERETETASWIDRIVSRLPEATAISLKIGSSWWMMKLPMGRRRRLAKLLSGRGGEPPAQAA